MIVLAVVVVVFYVMPTVVIVAALCRGESCRECVSHHPSGHKSWGSE